MSETQARFCAVRIRGEAHTYVGCRDPKDDRGEDFLVKPFFIMAPFVKQDGSMGFNLVEDNLFSLTGMEIGASEIRCFRNLDESLDAGVIRGIKELTNALKIRASGLVTR